MRQLSLFESCIPLAGLVPAMRAAMNAAAEKYAEGRKLLVDHINGAAHAANVRLTAGNQKSISKETLDKWLSPADRDHTPSIMAVAVFCFVTGNIEPVRILARILGLEVITKEEKDLLEYGRACREAEQAIEKRRKSKERLK